MTVSQRYSLRDRLRLSVARKFENVGNAGTGRDGSRNGPIEGARAASLDRVYLGEARRLLRWSWKMSREDTRAKSRRLAAAVFC
jgi:hypothetical protein